MTENMHYLKPILFLMLIVALGHSCYKDEVFEDEVSITNIEHPDEPASGTIVGIIQDENGHRIGKVHSELHDQSFYPGDEAVFFYEVDDLMRENSNIKLHHDNKTLTASLLFLEDEVNYIHSTLLTNPAKYLENTQNEVRIEEENMHLVIPAAVYKLNEQNYEGQLVISSFLPDLNNPFHLEAIPGKRLVLDVNEHNLWLDYQQVLYIDIKNDDGENLQLTQAARLAFVQLDCSDCAFWHFDEEKNKWIEVLSAETFDPQNIALKKSGFYSIARSHPYQNVFGQIQSDNQALPHFTVDIWQNNRLIERVYTTNNGKWFCPLPIDQDFEYRLLLDDETIKTYPVSTNMDETQLPILNITAEELQTLSIQGKSKNCLNEDMDEFFCFINTNNQPTAYFMGSSYESLLVPKYAVTDFSIYTANKSLEEFSPSILYEANSNLVNLDAYYNCDAYREGYFKLEIDGDERIFTVMESRLENGETKLIVYDEINLVSEFKISFAGSEARVYQDEELNILFDRVEIGDQSYEIRCENSETGCGFNVFEIKHYGKQKGDWIQGSFSGEFWVKSSEPKQVSYKVISGKFLVPRTFS
jgi:hypothetical protein